jgi:predicted amidohydrolase
MMDDKKRTEMRSRANRTTVPQIFINGQHVGGSDDLAALEQAGKLDDAARTAGLRTPNMTAFKAGLIQTNVSNDMAENVASLREQTKLARDAARRLHHDAGKYRPDRRQPHRDARPRRRPRKSMRCSRACRAAARDTGTWFLLGSIHVRVPGEEQIRNRAFVIDGSGGIAARYDKIHMFDVDLATGESWRESNAYAAGEQVAVVDSPAGRLGLAICYDLRFPALFEALGRARCDVIAVPAAFTVPTGKAHWHLLQRARAVEASAYVVAAAQVGRHEDGRSTYGHSLVVDPWGEVLLDLGGEAAGLVIADVDMAKIGEARKMVPSLTHDRKYAAPDAAQGGAVAKAAE